MRTTTTTALALALAFTATGAFAQQREDPCSWKGASYAERKACWKRNKDATRLEAMESIREEAEAAQAAFRAEMTRLRADALANPDRGKAEWLAKYRGRHEELGVTRESLEALWLKRRVYAWERYDRYLTD